MAMPNPSMSFSPFAILTAEEMNDLVENIESLADGSGVEDNAIGASKLATNAITLAYNQKTSTSTATSQSAITALSTTVTIPSGGRQVQITVFSRKVYNTGGPANTRLSLWDGTVGSGTQLADAEVTSGAANYGAPVTLVYESAISAGSKTFNVGLAPVGGSTATAEGSSTAPMFISVKLV